MEIITGKLSMLSSEGNRVRVRFSLPDDQNTLGDFLLKADHPAVGSLRVGKTYHVAVEEVTV